jgi:hypothetical protein
MAATAQQSGRKQKNRSGTEGIEAQALASFAPQFTRRGGRQLFISR